MIGEELWHRSVKLHPVLDEPRTIGFWHPLSDYGTLYYGYDYKRAKFSLVVTQELEDCF